MPKYARFALIVFTGLFGLVGLAKTGVHIDIQAVINLAALATAICLGLEK